MEKWMLGQWQPFMQPDGAGGASGNEGDAAAQEGQPGDEGQEQTPLTFDEMLAQNKEFQAELDRRMGKALDTARTNMLPEIAAQVQKAREEGAREALLSESEKENLAQQQREKDLAAREAALLRGELTLKGKSRLADKGLDPRLSGLLDYSSEEAWEASLQLVEQTIPDSVQEGVRKAMAGAPPAKGEAKPLADPNTMTVSEKMKLKNEDPAKYKKLFGG